jgi:hypothetical protein
MCLTGLILSLDSPGKIHLVVLPRLQFLVVFAKNVLKEVIDLGGGNKSLINIDYF